MKWFGFFYSFFDDIKVNVSIEIVLSMEVWSNWNLSQRKLMSNKNECDAHKEFWLFKLAHWPFSMNKRRKKFPRSKHKIWNEIDFIRYCCVCAVIRITILSFDFPSIKMNFKSITNFLFYHFVFHRLKYFLFRYWLLSPHCRSNGAQRWK